MSGCTKYVVFFLALAIGNVIYFISKQSPDDALVDEDFWWGTEPHNQDRSIQPFKISVPQKALDDLKQRLDSFRQVIPPLHKTNHIYGINAELLDQIVAYWKKNYNWREQEAFLNSLPQFHTRIQGLNMHFIHARPSPNDIKPNTKIIPLLLLHGWPGSVREFYEVIAFLLKPQPGYNFVFEIVAPSLPGYGFSEATTKPGLGVRQVAVVMHKLMQRIGYERYYVQGGDWGSIIATNMAYRYPNNVKGLHLNMCFSNALWSRLKWLLGSFWPSLVVDKEHEHLMYPISKHLTKILLESGYMHIQATKPDTVGVALTDSPAGLAAYILEKFITWTNSEFNNVLDGGLKNAFGYNKLLDNIMIYWITGSITSSMRLYAESMNTAQNELSRHLQIKTPTACATFEYELLYQSESLVKDTYTNLIQINHYKKGGHFAAFEQPELLGRDILAAVAKFENANQAVPPKTP